MPIQYEVYPDERIVISTLVGELAVKDYAESARQIIADNRLEPVFGLLIDGRALDPLPTFEELRELVDVARDLRAHGIEPFALVAATELQYIVGQLFATLVGGTLNLDARVFRDIDSARYWLKQALEKRRANQPGDSSRSLS
jgi:hypothetical protein